MPPAASRCANTSILTIACETDIALASTHKPWCNNNADHLTELQQADERGQTRGLPPGITHVELDQKLEKWVKYHNALLMAATIHALALPRDIRRSQTYMLRVKLAYRPDHGGVSSKYFRVLDASVIDFETAKTFGKIWVASIDQITKLRTDSETMRRGTVAAVALECAPLAMQIVPFGSLRDLSPLVIQQQWKEILIRDVEAGKKLSRFEM
ncbi:unnamed protein product [Cyclocybe aegerita]|uniref:Uncharacterized protein n=1 Tax=Cyclocybe aegerita TaxID=1973307 RepID=A0A8S0VTY2_CYCAE|nr:unnamed protein product [Cyclocybe aegerita]